MPDERDRVIIIGAGANGLVAGFYLAKAGIPTLILERRAVVGGTLVTEEIHPGFRCPTVLHSVEPLPPKVARDMQFHTRGLEFITPDVRVLALSPYGDALRIYDDPERTASDLRGRSRHDSQNYVAFHATFERLGNAIAPLLSMTPPDMEHPAIGDYLNLARIGLKFRGLDKKDEYRLLRWIPMAVADLAGEWFETELLRAVVEARGVFGTFAGPWSAGTSIGLLLQAAGDGRAFSGSLSLRGNAGALTDVLANCARAAGAQIRTSAPVAGIRVSGNEAQGVVLENGEEIAAKAIISSADPKQTFLKLVEPSDLGPAFLAKIKAYRTPGIAAKVNLALSRLPQFSAAGNGSGDLSGRIHIAPDTDYLERAFDCAKYGEFSSRPYLDMTIPSLMDSSLAPKGGHVMSVHVQYAPYALKSSDWSSRREEFADAVIDTISEYARDIRETILSREILTPVDLQRIYGLTGGHIFHGERVLDQLFAFRPVLGLGRYRTPINRLYLCGSGTHPGGGMTGASGANASREILRDLK